MRCSQRYTWLQFGLFQFMLARQACAADLRATNPNNEDRKASFWSFSNGRNPGRALAQTFFFGIVRGAVLSLQALSNSMENYASVKLNRIVERLVKEVLIDRPSNVVPYLIQFLEEHGEQVATLIYLLHASAACTLRRTLVAKPPWSCFSACSERRDSDRSHTRR
jgi:hypothetical protein